MKTKITILACGLFLAGFFSVSAIGLGLQGDAEFSNNVTGGLALAFSPNRLVNTALSWHFGEITVLGFTADVQALNKPISTFSSGVFGFTLGGGVFTRLLFGGEAKFSPSIGLRIPVGVNLILSDRFEVYAHVAPSFGLNFYPELAPTNFFVPAALGFRVWFDSGR